MDDTLLLVGGGAAGLFTLAVVAVVLKYVLSRKAPSTKSDKKVRDLVAAGDYEAAASRALELNDLESAYELYLRAQQLQQAAKVAQRLGKFNVAAALLEQDGDVAQAVALYRKAGLMDKARELEAAPPKPAEPAAAPGSTAGASAGSAPIEATPIERATQLEESFRAARRAQGATPSSEPDPKMDALAQKAAEAWMTAGDSRRAAELYKEAGLLDQAVNLFLTVLGEPATAAALVAARGDHKRAAELYEAAGQKDRALAAWVSWTNGAEDPFIHVRDVARLGADAVIKLVLSVLSSRPLAAATLDLHYRAARLLEQGNQPAHALPVFEAIAKLDPRFRDVGERLTALRPPAVSAAPAPAPARAPAPPPAPPAAPAASAALLGPPSSVPPRPGPPRPAALRSSPNVPSTKPALDQDAAARAAAHMERGLEQATVRAGDSGQRRKVTGGVAKASPVARPAAASSPPVASGASAPVVDVTIVHAKDDAIEAAKNGPSMEDLRKMLGDRPPDLANIEIYYRLGLALTARGQWEEAHAAFSAVEDVSPGYRDAWKRLEELDTWRKNVGQRMFPRKRGNGATEGERYQLIGELGRGSKAVVYRAKDETLGCDVALKCLTADAADKARFMSAFEREATAAATLDHPNIVTIHDVRVHEERAFVAMELLEGASIEATVAKNGPLSLTDALEVTECVLDALEHAHEKDIVHRDIKPANIMRTTTGDVKLMDFGLAAASDGAAKVTPGSSTRGYKAPEQLAGTDVDARADVFAVGASLYRMLSGKEAFESEARTAPPTPLRELLPGFPQVLAGIVEKALTFERDERYASATDMLAELRAFGARPAQAEKLPPARARQATMLGVAPSGALAPGRARDVPKG